MPNAFIGASFWSRLQAKRTLTLGNLETLKSRVQELPVVVKGLSKTGIVMKAYIVFPILMIVPNIAFADQAASGQIFNPDGLTAAQRSLPFGSCIVVQNPKTGKTVRVTINDRGPFTPGLTLDLSAGTARAIGMRSTQNVTMRRC